MPRTAGLHPHFRGSKKVTGAEVQRRRVQRDRQRTAGSPVGRSQRVALTSATHSHTGCLTLLRRSEAGLGSSLALRHRRGGPLRLISGST
jgi:hypothetical protein